MLPYIKTGTSIECVEEVEFAGDMRQACADNIRYLVFESFGEFAGRLQDEELYARTGYGSQTRDALLDCRRYARPENYPLVLAFAPTLELCRRFESAGFSEVMQEENPRWQEFVFCLQHFFYSDPRTR